MLRFFRNIRQKLLLNGNLRKYFWYALGEILLVMIGILLALQVNNWNEQRKQEREATKMLSDLEKTIEREVIESAGFSEIYYSPFVLLDSLHSSILNDSLDQFLQDKPYMESSFNRSLVNNPMLNSLGGLGYLYNENISIILENERNYPEQYERALRFIRSLEASFQSMEDQSAAINVLQQEVLKYLSDQKWFNKFDAVSMEQRVQFFHNDTYYRNRLIQYNELQNLFINQYDIYRKYELFYWLEFQMQVEGKDFEELIPTLESAGLVRAEEVPCNSQFIEDPVHSFYYWNVVYNNTTEPVDLFVRDRVSGAQRYYSTVQPDDFSGRYTTHETPYLQTGNNNVCERQFPTHWNTFVVIDP